MIYFSILIVILGVILIGYKCLNEFFPNLLNVKKHKDNPFILFCKNLSKTLSLKFSENIKIIIYFIIILAASRLLLSIIAYIGCFVFGNMEVRGFFDMLEDIWARCDSPRYLHIAENGYLATGEYNDIINIAFYPLYPLLIYLFHFIFGNYFYSAIFVSFISLVVACFYFYKLLLLDYDTETSQRTVKYFLIYPFSIFLSAVYTESTFMALSLMCIYYMRKKNWPACGLFGLLAAFCRTQGILLLIPVVYEIVLDLWKNRKWDFKYLFAFTIPMGYGAYLALNKIITGDWFKFMEYQAYYWRHEFTWFHNSLKETLDYILMGDTMRNMVNWIPQFLMFFISIILLIVFVNKIRTSYILYAFSFIIISYSTTLLLSGPRYLIGAFPLFISMGLLGKNKTIDRLLTLFFIMFQSVIMIAYAFDRHIL